jgi:hypothetical protein
MSTTKPRQAAVQKKKQQRNSGKPGGGKGRREEVSHSSVYPASGPLPPGRGAVIRSQAEWGQGERGAAGYEDHGESELRTLPPSDEPLKRQPSTKRVERKTAQKEKR